MNAGRKAPDVLLSRKEIGCGQSLIIIFNKRSFSLPYAASYDQSVSSETIKDTRKKTWRYGVFVSVDNWDFILDSAKRMLVSSSEASAVDAGARNKFVRLSLASFIVILVVSQM